LEEVVKSTPKAGSENFPDGLDDQDFVVAFEADSAAEFLDLVQDLRETESSKYTVRDTPMYTCRRTTVEAILESLG